MKQKTRNGNKGESEGVGILGEIEAGLEVGLVELEPEDLGVVFIEGWVVLLVLGLVAPLSELGARIGGVGSPDGGPGSAGWDVVRVDVGVEAAQEQDWDFEQRQEQSQTQTQ